jgi:hypothetical protein
MEQTFKESLRQQQICEFIAANQPVSQTKIVKFCMQHHPYTNLQSARVSVGDMLKKLQANGRIIKISDAMPNTQGSLYTNTWKMASQ